MDLKALVEDIEKNIGLFSKTYKIIDEHHRMQHAQDIPFEKKPAQQFLAGLGGISNKNAPLSIQQGVKPLEIDEDVIIIIKDFTALSPTSGLKISATRINKLRQSAQLYVNTNLFPAGLYKQALEYNLVDRHPNSESDYAQTHWQNLAVGVCHAQEIDLLVSATNSTTGKAITTVRDEAITDDAPTILLLSNPRLKFKGGIAAALPKERQANFIEGMYRNLFDATVSEGRDYIAMPAVGIGASGGKPAQYFEILMTVAQEYPQLNIIYHPDEHHKEFDAALKKANPDLKNVAKATKNILFIADALTKSGKPCALHCSADSNAVYGLCDVGGSWKDDKKYTLEKYIGTMTTAALNGRGFNLKAFTNITERYLQKPHIEETSTRTKETKPDTAPVVIIPSPALAQPIPSQQPHTPPSSDTNAKKPKPPSSAIPLTALPAKSQQTVPKASPPIQKAEPSSIKPGNAASENHAMKSTPAITAAPPPPITLASAPPAASNSQTLFKPVSIKETTTQPQKPTKSNLSKDQQTDIDKMIDNLQGEIDSCWPYPNKDLKKIKINALNFLKVEAKTQTIEQAIALVKLKFPEATKGAFSSRTADFFDRLSPPNDQKNAVLSS
ncbi:MAG: hypothetical protein ACHP65_04025 [Legionellales bacterium]